jgi:diguanylate cyclase (GGDEF)-like protein
MNLDTRTIMVMFSILNLMFAGLLELAGLRAGNILGIRHWAFANLCFGLGLGLAYFVNIHTPWHNWAIVFGATLVAAGIGLQFTGIQAFKGGRSDWRITSFFVVVVFFQSLWLAVLHPDISARSIANSILFAMGNAACARALFIGSEHPLKIAYGFTGMSFAILVMVLLIRAMVIWSTPSGTYGLYENIPLNSLSFFIGNIVQLCVTCGFILMLNYRLIADIQKTASRDVLTGAFSRRRLEEEADRQWAHCSRTGDTLAIMMIDVDYFKSVNDTYGHPAGDEVLRRLALVAQSSIRADDFLARYGGEEFCILLPSTTEEDALLLAERLRGIYAAATIEFGGNSMKSTISIGVADSTHAGLEFSSLVTAADQALYRAKQEGRNRVVSHSTMD